MTNEKINTQILEIPLYPMLINDFKFIGVTAPQKPQKN